MKYYSNVETIWKKGELTLPVIWNCVSVDMVIAIKKCHLFACNELEVSRNEFDLLESV